jgi:hypothetical protein
VNTAEAIIETDLTFIRLVRERSYLEALAMIDQVSDINVCDPQSRATALHFAALRSVAGLLEALEQRADLDYLVQDRDGRYPSELAWEMAGNEELGARLQRKEQEQAERQGVRAWPKPDPLAGGPS